MSTESSSVSCDRDRARDALEEIRRCSGELHTFVTGLFDQLGRLADELLTHELTRQQVQQQSEREALQKQIDRLASVASQMTETLAEQKGLLGSQVHVRAEANEIQVEIGDGWQP